MHSAYYIAHSRSRYPRMFVMLHDNSVQSRAGRGGCAFHLPEVQCLYHNLTISSSFVFCVCLCIFCAVQLPAAKFHVQPPSQPLPNPSPPSHPPQRHNHIIKYPFALPPASAAPHPARPPSLKSPYRHVPPRPLVAIYRCIVYYSVIEYSFIYIVVYSFIFTL